jgi:hypothetical protein
MVRKNPTRNSSLKPKRALASSEALGWLPTSTPKKRAPRSGLRPTREKLLVPAMVRTSPRSTRSSAWPLRSMMRIRRGRTRSRPRRARAHTDGKEPEERVRKTTAMISCMMRMPTAVRPWSEAISPFSSSTFTAKTVLEKLRAKATTRSARVSRLPNRASPALPSSAIPTQKKPMVTAMCRVVPAHISGLRRLLTLSFSPMVKRRR